MMTHPKTYTLTRAEWLEINQALASAVLAIALPQRSASIAKASDRLARVRAAHQIMSKAYWCAMLYGM